jgi:hypothetical protein
VGAKAKSRGFERAEIAFETFQAAPYLEKHLRAIAPGAPEIFTAMIRCDHCKGTGKSPPRQARIEPVCPNCKGPGGWAWEGTASELLAEVQKLMGV